MILELSHLIAAAGSCIPSINHKANGKKIPQRKGYNCLFQELIASWIEEVRSDDYQKKKHRWAEYDAYHEGLFYGPVYS